MKQKTITITFDPNLRAEIQKYLDRPDAKFKTLSSLMHYVLSAFVEDEERKKIEREERKKQLDSES